MRSPCRSRRRWNIDEWPKRRKCKKKENWKDLDVLELLTTNKGNKEATKEKTLIVRIVLCVTKTQIRNKATNFAIETETKTFS